MKCRKVIDFRIHLRANEIISQDNWRQSIVSITWERESDSSASCRLDFYVFQQNINLANGALPSYVASQHFARPIAEMSGHRDDDTRREGENAYEALLAEWKNHEKIVARDSTFLAPFLWRGGYGFKKIESAFKLVRHLVTSEALYTSSLLSSFLCSSKSQINLASIARKNPPDSLRLQSHPDLLFSN